jgi:hypothetical protein
VKELTTPTLILGGGTLDHVSKVDCAWISS